MSKATFTLLSFHFDPFLLPKTELFSSLFTLLRFQTETDIYQLVFALFLKNASVFLFLTTRPSRLLILAFSNQARSQLNWNGGGGGHGSQYIVLSELLSDQAAFITSPKISLANYWGGALPSLPPSVYGPANCSVFGVHTTELRFCLAPFLFSSVFVIVFI